MIPGEYILKKGEIKANVGYKTTSVTVKNVGDRPIQVGSHYHFFEVNKMLSFDREESFGMRLNIPASTAVRFEPGEQKKVILVEMGGNKEIHGFNGLTNGKYTDPKVKKAALEKAKKLEFKDSK
ncbi:urease subunit beta [Sphingobacterium sp. UDSM-2020]|jgi:urease subunit beta|uniref:urease subunit beta n=1 Tax=Sphingobacterium faecium TaxID=34087 RepID=UPI001042959F|nr:MULTISPECIES: urease subunit beta [Sphingobacterium]MBB2954158.1 urease subunit beta [Sphingobacterium sp. JUb56]MCS3553516.1 urease subunit beta [Sphingobacterium sp. JUb21]MCW2262194.1 urease subunit beta [Sphingobacterium kitahiroshimense]QQD15487.1 urease subunit beta [Sphingobacterium sp. UDSM-2020]TCR09274.1 urease subunit beta [Sphingobacterium sp. JUb20]